MPRKPAIDNAIALYDISQRYRSVPSEPSEQKKLVNIIYERVKAPGGRVPVGRAEDRRIYHVANNVFNKAYAKYNNLTRTEKFIMDRLLRINRMQGDQREAGIERLCIQIEACPDDLISERVEDAAVQVLGYRLKIAGKASPHGVPF